MRERSPLLLLTCEHAGNRIPAPYRYLFRGAGALLASHRGYDPGALALARRLSRLLDTPLLAVTTSRLLVEANRSPTHPHLFSSFTAKLSTEARREILEDYYLPHRERVEGAANDAIASGRRVLHLAIHSFTPVLDGEARHADLALLYDPRRRPEVSLCAAWVRALRDLEPGMRVRRNYPYAGKADGLTTALRRRFAVSRYLGVEIEVNQALLAADASRVRALAQWIDQGLHCALSGSPTPRLGPS